MYTTSPIAKNFHYSNFAGFSSSQRLASSSVRYHAFLHGDLYEEVHIEAHDEYDIPSGKVLKLHISLYSLKQALVCEIFHSLA